MRLIYLAGSLLALLGCATPPPSAIGSAAPTPSLQRLELPAMGTLWVIEARGEPGLLARLRPRFEAELREFEAVFSDWVEDSELRRLERAGLGQWQRPSARFFRGLEWAAEACRLSQGRFDITIGAVQWKALSRPVGCATLELEDGRARFARDPRRLSFGGLVKGAAVGALAYQARAAARDVRINAGGGNAFLSGEFALAEGLDDGDHLVSHSFSDDRSGRAHILDPQTGRALPAARGASVRCRLAPASAATSHEWLRLGALADAASTAAVVDPTLDFGLPSCKVYRLR